MRIPLIIGVLTLITGALGADSNCPSFFEGTDCKTIQCVNGGYPDVNNSNSTCICPPGYLGIHCEAVKTSQPPLNHFKAGGTSFNILNVNLYTQYWGVNTYSNIKTAVEAFQNSKSFDKYNYVTSTGAPYLDNLDNPAGFPIQFITDLGNTAGKSLVDPTDTGIYKCYQVDIYSALISLIRTAQLKNTAITIITQHPPTPSQLEEAQQSTVAFGIRVNVLWISDVTFNRCEKTDVDAFKAFVELTGGLFVQLQAELGDTATQSLVTQVLATHYKPQFVSIQSFDSCDTEQTVPVVIDPVVNGPYNFIFLGANASPSVVSYQGCHLQQPLRSFDNQLSIYQSPDPECSQVSIKATGACTLMVFTNGNSTAGPLDLQVYTTYVEEPTIDSSRYGIIENVAFYPAFHVESGSSLVTVNSIYASFDRSWNPTLQRRAPAAYEWIPDNTVICDSTKTYSLFLNITVGSSNVQRAVRIACLKTPPPASTIETSSTSVTTVVTTPAPIPTTTSGSSSISSTITSGPQCSQPGVPYSFLFAYSTELDAKTYGLVSATVVQAIDNYPFSGVNLTDAYLDSTVETVNPQPSVTAFSNQLVANQPNAAIALGETLGSNVVSIIENFISTTTTTDKPLPLENSILLLLPNRLQIASAADLSSDNYNSFVNKNVKMFTIISLASLVSQGGMTGRTGKVFNKLAAVSNGHYIVANETIGSDVNSDFNKIAAQVMRFGYGQDLLFSRNVGNGRLGTDLGAIRIPQASSPGSMVTVTITVSLSVVETNAPNPPNRLLLAFKPAVGSSENAVAINFLTDSAVTRYESSNFYTTTVNLTAGEERGLVLQYMPGEDNNDLLIRMWVDRSTYHSANYVDFTMTSALPNDKEGAALRVTLNNDCYNNVPDQAKILITDCNGQVSTKDDTDQLSSSTLISDPVFKYFGFVPFFCDSPPSTSASCIAGTEAKYDVQFNFADYSVTRSFWCFKSSEAFNPKCEKTDSNGNYQCTGASPFMRGPTGQVPDCAHGKLGVNFAGGIGNETYQCQCEDGYDQPNCAAASCPARNVDSLAIDNSYRTFTLVLGIDSNAIFSLAQGDVQSFLKLSAADVASIWKFQLLVYCADGTVTNLYSGGYFQQFWDILNGVSTNVNCNSPATNGSVDLTTVYQASVQGLGRNVRGMILYFTESQNVLNVTLNDFIVASRPYRQELFVLTAIEFESDGEPLPSMDPSISQAAMSTGGFLVQSLVDAEGNIPIDGSFISTMLAGKTSLAYVSSQQSTRFTVTVNSASTTAWVVTWGIGQQFEIDNTGVVVPSTCTYADHTMAMCQLTGSSSYAAKAPSTATTYTVAVFITNEDTLSPRFQIVSDLSQDASDAVSTSTSATRTIIAMYVPDGYKVVDNDGDGGLTRTISRSSCTFQYTAYSVFDDAKYAAGVNTAMITLQKSDGDAASPKYTRYFSFGTTASATCQNGGFVIPSTGACDCPAGFQGPDCSLVNCVEASTANAWSDVCVCDSLEDVWCAIRYTPNPSFCQHPQWTFTFLFAYSPGLNINLYRKIVQSVLNIATSNPENVFRDAYLDDPTNEAIRQPKDFSSFSADLASYAPYHQLSSPTSNLIKIIENFIPTAQETSEYSGKTSNWLENSFLLLLPKSLPEGDSEDLSATNYTSFINRNVKVFIVMDQNDVSSETDDVRFRIFSKLTAATNGHFIVGDMTSNVIDKIMQIGYESDLVFTRNIVNASASGLTREIGKWKTPRRLVNVTVTISESVITGYPEVPVELKLRFESPKSAAFEVDLLAFGDVYKNSNFHSTSISSLLPDTTYTVSVTYTSSSIRDLLIRFWMPRVYSQYTEFIDLDFYPTDPNDKEGAAMRMTVLNNCWQLARAEISISDCTGAQSRKYDVNQVSGVPIGTEGSYPKFAFVPFFCDKFTRSCVKGAEDKYDVQLVVGDFSISRSFQCLPSLEPINPNCKSTDSNGNVHCTRTTLPYKRGPTGRLTDCLDRGFLQFDSIDTQDYVCICDSGYEGVSCQN